MKTLKTLVLKTATVAGVKPVTPADRIGLGFDVANAYMTQDPSEGLREAAPLLALVHYSDTHKTSWGHLPLGLGEVDFAATTVTLREIGYHGPIILETTFPQDPDRGIRYSLAALAELGLTPPRAAARRHD